jgi:hypothetical protein
MMKNAIFGSTVVVAIIVMAASSVSAQSLIYVSSYDSLIYATGIVVGGDYAFVSDNVLGLVILDISDPFAPSAVGRYPAPLWIYDMKLLGDTIFLAAGSSEPYSGALYIVDVTDKHSPSLIGSISFPWEAVAVDIIIADFLDWHYAYIGSGGEIKIVDFANPENPILAGSFPLAGGILDIAITSNLFIHIASGSNGVRFVDAIDPLNLQLLSTLDTPGTALRLAINQTRHWVDCEADGDSGFITINAGDPHSPFIAGRLVLPGRTKQVISDSVFAYAAMGDSGFAVIEINNLSSPQILSSTADPGHVEGIGLIGDYLAGYIAVAGGESMKIYELDTQRCDYIPGDINHNGTVNGIDIVYAVSHLKGGNPPPVDCNPPCSTGVADPFYASMDVNGNCQVNGIDVMYYIAYLGGWQPRLRYCLNCWPGY